MVSKPQGPKGLLGGGGDVLGQIQQLGQIAAGLGLIGNAVGEQLLIAGQLGFRLQHLKLGCHTRLEAGAGIAQTHQRGAHGLLADADVVVAELQLEIGLRGLKPQLAQSN